MLSKDEFPYTLGGYVEQQSYQGFDIAVSFIKHKGAELYVFAPDKRIVHKERFTFGDKQEMFQSGRNAIDRHLQYKEQKAQEAMRYRTENLRKKTWAAAMKAFASAMYFSKIDGKAYEDAKGSFEYELGREYNKVFQ